VTEKAASSVHKTNLRVAAIVLAAGEARRMGSAKGLLPWRGETLLRHCVQTALASQCDEVYIVLGAHEDALRPEVTDLDAHVVQHENWQEGMGSSLAAAARKLPPHLDGVVVLLCDQPFVSAALIDELITRADGHTMVASSYNDTIGAPAYFAAALFPELQSLSEDRGAKALLHAQPESVETIAFPEGAFDIDDPEGYERALVELARR
jgi:molybdenum cofactor cytidylyltransferase